MRSIFITLGALVLAGHRPLVRGALVALDRWVKDGTRHSRSSSSTRVAPRASPGITVTTMVGLGFGGRPCGFPECPGCHAMIG